ncbi:methionine/alanine import family NSS transporter small subunit [Georgenia sp. TF02-10]|uniref:methionine/alanine import family NSS transporter small subunit n=1 Tax=Georgenia sp. TF02-10 TaxID=2917725 RepID=UPI001FA6D764|nr:methionine/alanine import family NSS transporter small subunit [Georgenia sp. TF02-10]UNX53661.1 methionine/alanine import family NSS transporter small subunit [Georgenia sp. TF02-10]
MTPVAILMMIIAIVVVWGGLVVAITFLVRHPVEDVPDADRGGAPSPRRGNGAP